MIVVYRRRETATTELCAHTISLVSGCGGQKRTKCAIIFCRFSALCVFNKPDYHNWYAKKTKTNKTVFQFWNHNLNICNVDFVLMAQTWEVLILWD